MGRQVTNASEAMPEIAELAVAENHMNTKRSWLRSQAQFCYYDHQQPLHARPRPLSHRNRLLSAYTAVRRTGPLGKGVLAEKGGAMVQYSLINPHGKTTARWAKETTQQPSALSHFIYWRKSTSRPSSLGMKCAAACTACA